MKVMARISLESLQIAYEAVENNIIINRDFNLLDKISFETCMNVSKLLKLLEDLETKSVFDMPNLLSYNEDIIDKLKENIRTQTELLYVRDEIKEQLNIN